MGTPLLSVLHPHIDSFHCEGVTDTSVCWDVIVVRACTGAEVPAGQRRSGC